jgi:hypothetical protein
MTCAFRGRGFCRRVAVFVCTLCGDHVCAEHAVPEYHFNVRRVGA